MKLHVDLETLQLIQGPGQRSAVSSLRFKRGDSARLQVVFLENGVTPAIIGDPGTLEIQIGIKPRNQFDRSYLVHSADWSMPSEGDDAPAYECAISFNTLQLDSALNIGSASAGELPEITLMGEITWREGTGEPTSTRTFLVVVENDVNRGTEGVPVSAEPPYPPPGNLVTNSNLGDRAVRHDAAQNLTAEQKTQARANIGAIGEIANGSLAIAKTAGLQSALNGKAASHHTHPIQDVANLEWELGTKLGFIIGKAPEELDSAESTRTLILEKAGFVWLCKPGSGAVAIAGGSPPNPGQAPMLQQSFTSLEGGATSQTGTVEVQPGTYQVTVSAAGFTTSSWGSHYLILMSASGATTFYNEQPGGLYGLFPDQAGSWAAFYLADPATAANPQEGTIMLSVSQPETFHVEGYLPMGGDSVFLTITFTPI